MVEYIGKAMHQHWFNVILTSQTLTQFYQFGVFAVESYFCWKDDSAQLQLYVIIFKLKRSRPTGLALLLIVRKMSHFILTEIKRSFRFLEPQNYLCYCLGSY